MQALMESVKRADAKLLVVANHGPGEDQTL